MTQRSFGLTSGATLAIAALAIGTQTTASANTVAPGAVHHYATVAPGAVHHYA